MSCPQGGSSGCGSASRASSAGTRSGTACRSSSTDTAHPDRMQNVQRGIFWIFLYDIQHCFVCCPSDSTVSEDAGIEPRAFATTALAIRRSNHSARSVEIQNAAFLTIQKLQNHTGEEYSYYRYPVLNIKISLINKIQKIWGMVMYEKRTNRKLQNHTAEEYSSHTCTCTCTLLL